MSASHAPFLTMDRMARSVCDAEVADLTATVVHPTMVESRRARHAETFDALIQQANEAAKQLDVPFSEWEPKAYGFGGSVGAVMIGLENSPSWWEVGRNDPVGAAEDLLQRIEACRQASASLQRFAEWHGVTDAMLQWPADASPPPTWDDVLDKVEQRLNQARAVANPPGNDDGKKKGRGGRRRLAKANPLKLQVYQRIQQEHQSGTGYRDDLDRLKADKDFVQQVKDAGLKLDTSLVRKALAHRYQNNRREALNKQQTDSN